MTTTEIAEQLDLGRRSTHERLERLVDHDRLETKNVGGNGRVWWQPSTTGQASTKERQQDAIDSDLGEVFDRISDSFYALDEAFRFRYLNDTAAELFGLDEDAIGSDIRDQNLTETFENALYEALETQESATFEDYYPPWDRWFQNTVYPSDSGLSVYTHDITERKRRERELARYETIVETSPVGITIVDDDGELQFANDRAEEIYGRSKDQINDLSFDDSDWNEVDVDGGPLPDEEKPFPKILESGEPIFNHISGVSRPDGERVWVSINGAPVYGDRGEIDSVVFTTEDISDRFERERQLEQYETVVETAHDGIYVLDEERRFELVNDSFADLTPFSRAELRGQHASTVFGEEFAAIEAEQWSGGSEDDPPTFEETIDIGPGETRSVENRFVILDESGGEERIGVLRDITERKAHQRKLEKSEQRYRTLVESFPNGAITMFTEDLRYTFADGQILDEIDLPVDKLEGTTIHDLYPDDLAADLEPAFRAVFEGESTETDVSFLGRTWNVHIVPVRDGNGDVFMGMLVAVDITERNEYKRKLEESNERLEQFAYAASHDLQEPLRMVTSYLQLLEQRYGDELDEDAREFIDYAVDGAERMREMIDGLLEYARVKTRGDPFEPVELDEVLDQVCTDLQIRIENSDAHIGLTALPRVNGDRGQLRQVFQNLLTNAIEYSGDNPPRIAVSAERDGSMWRISVHDEGIGIDPDEGDCIFEVFQRLHSRNESEGTGIGLALCRRIIERHGGEIWVESESGEGSTFSFTLPPAHDHE
ncbi:PAS domain-containing protein [Natronococcus sp. A-GB7]|uniref:PAS domain-containing sensor histidine kinase n=1 Tax=Natronococcus sp. A-GB7 TaxID=3037649 RepID=UPI00241DAB57|nr:PAS domain-containing protein [Natronococcus sp. A-GB7]MDG5819944.1 PAS domain-containing protein [Natronococcus sp. A-GB7]